MKRTIVSAAVLALMTGGIGTAIAGPGEENGPGPNGKNNYGLCKAYFAGSDQGREQKRKAGPFRALEEAAGVEAEDDTQEERDEVVAEYCAAFGPGGKEEHPGGGKG